MKKFMKVCAIIALILVLVGLALGIAGSTAKGRNTISEVVENVTGGRVRINLNPTDRNWGITIGDDIFDSLDEVNYDIKDSVSFDSNYPVLSGDIDKYSLEGTVANLEIEAGGCSFRVKESEDDSFYVEAKGVGKFQTYVENETLYMKTTTVARQWSEISGSKITLYVPANCNFGEIKINLGAGVLEFPNLHAENAALEVGAGQIEADGAEVQRLEINVGMGQIRLTDMNVTDLTAEVGMGELVAKGAVNGNVDAECSMGNLELRIAGKQEDFNYELSGAMGNLTLDGKSYSGFSQEKSIDNGAAKKMELDCSMGNVTVKFEK